MGRKKKEGSNYIFIIPPAPYYGFYTQWGYRIKIINKNKNKNINKNINNKELSEGEIIGIVLGSSAFCIILALLIIYFSYKYADKRRLYCNCRKNYCEEETQTDITFQQSDYQSPQKPDYQPPQQSDNQLPGPLYPPTSIDQTPCLIYQNPIQDYPQGNSSNK